MNSERANELAITMNNGKKAENNNIYSLIPVEEFKSILGIDDREDNLARYCLLTSTYTIEQYCKRRLLRKKYFERLPFMGDLFLPLREYPVTQILAVYALESGEILEPEFYHTIPDCGLDCDFPFTLSLSPAARHYYGLAAFKAVYWAGYSLAKIPPDLGTACLELAAWNMARYRGRRIGMTGSVRGNGRDGEHLETAFDLLGFRFKLYAQALKTGGYDGPGSW